MNEHVEEYPEIDEELQAIRERHLEASKQNIIEHNIDEWILNNDEERLESEEEGAL